MLKNIQLIKLRSKELCSASFLGLLAIVLAPHSHATTLWSPGTPCTGCYIEIIDHAGVARTPSTSGGTSAVWKINSPEVATPSGPATAPFLEIYNPTLSRIDKCAKAVQSIKKPRPGSVGLKAREFTLAGSSRVVFLVEGCKPRKGPKPGPKIGIKPGDGPGPGHKPGDDLGPGPGPGHGSSEEEPEVPGGTTACASGDTPASTSCVESGGGWQTVSNVLSEDSCQLGYTDASAGPGRRVIYDNSYSVTCNGSSYEPSVSVGMTRSASNWGAFNDPSETCRMKTGTRPSDGARVVEKILCPNVPR